MDGLDGRQAAVRTDELNTSVVHDHIVTWTEYPLALVLDLEIEGPVRQRFGSDVDTTLSDRIGFDVLEPIVHDLGSIEVDDSGTGQGQPFKAGEQGLLEGTRFFGLRHNLAESGDGDFQRLILEINGERREDRQHDCFVRERGFNQTCNCRAGGFAADYFEHVWEFCPIWDNILDRGKF